MIPVSFFISSERGLKEQLRTQVGNHFTYTGSVGPPTSRSVFSMAWKQIIEVCQLMSSIAFAVLQLPTFKGNKTRKKSEEEMQIKCVKKSKEHDTKRYARML